MNVLSKDLLLRLPEVLYERTQELCSGWTRPRGFVLYWMSTAMRAHENPALDVAIEAANFLGLPLFVYQGLSERYPNANDRHHQFILEGARDVALQLSDRGIGYAFHLERDGHRGPVLKQLLGMSALMVTEDMPLPFLQRWLKTLASDFLTPIWAVDSVCVVPMKLARRTYHNIDQFETELDGARQRRLLTPWLSVELERGLFRPTLPFEAIDLQQEFGTLIGQCSIDHAVPPVNNTEGGTRQGQRTWKKFIKTQLRLFHRYSQTAGEDWMGGIVPYLSYGQVSPFSLARDVMGAGSGGKVAFRALVIEREFAFHYAYRERGQATLVVPTVEGAPTERTRVEIVRMEEGDSSDEHWNVLHKSLMIRGRLHPLFWSYWAAKVLQCSSSSPQGSQMMSLYRRYALDGFMPSSTVGLLRSQGFFSPRLAAKSHSDETIHQLSKRLSSGLSVAILGTSLAGFFCAQLLRRYNANVQIYPTSLTASPQKANRWIAVSDRRFADVVTKWETMEWVRRHTVQQGDLAQASQHQTQKVYLSNEGFAQRFERNVPVHNHRVEGMQWRGGWQLNAVGSKRLYDQVVVVLPLTEASIVPDFLWPQSLRTAVQRKTIWLWVTVKEGVSGSWNRMTIQNPIAEQLDVLSHTRTELRIQSTAEWAAEQWDESLDRIGQRMVKSTWSLFGGERNIQSIVCERVMTFPNIKEGVLVPHRHLSFCGTEFGEGGTQAAWLSACACVAQIMRSPNRTI